MSTYADRTQAKQKAKVLLNLLYRRICAAVDGHLIIVDSRGRKHDFGQAPFITIRLGGVKLEWSIHLKHNLDAMHQYIEAGGLRVSCRPINQRYAKNDILNTSVDIGTTGTLS